MPEIKNNENPDLAWGFMLEHWINIGTSTTPEWIKATELLSWASDTQNTEYTSSWLDRKNQSTFIMGQTQSITWDKDTVVGGKLDAWAFENRNKTDVPCEVAEVYTWVKDGESKCRADKASYLFTPNSLSNATAGQPVSTGGVLNRSSDGNIEGTWDMTEKTWSETTVTPEG